MEVLLGVTEKFHLYPSNRVHRFEGHCQPEQETPKSFKARDLSWLHTSWVTRLLHEAGATDSNHNRENSVSGSLLRYREQLSFVCFEHVLNVWTCLSHSWSQAGDLWPQVGYAVRLTCLDIAQRKSRRPSSLCEH